MIKLGKKATVTSGMIQTAFRPCWMKRASVFEWHKRFKEGRGSVRDDEMCGGVKKSIHQSWLAKGLGLGLLCWDFKGVQEEIPSEEASTLQIGSVAFPTGQCTSPQLHPNSHRLFDQAGHQDSPPSLALWHLVIFSAQRLWLWDNWGDERGCNEGPWHAHTRRHPWGLHEVFGTVRQVHCSR